jgi:integrase
MRGTVRKRGKAWQALLTVKDSATSRTRQLSATHPTKAEAERWLTLTAARYGLGEGAAHSMSVAELLDTWYDQKAPDWSPSNRRNMRNAIDKVVVPRFGDTAVLKLRASDLDQWYTTLRRTMNPGTIRKYHNIIHAAYKMAERYDWVPSNPAGKASPPKITRKPIDVPARTDVLALLEAAKRVGDCDLGSSLEPCDACKSALEGGAVTTCERRDERLGFAVHLAAMTGARRGEILALRWSDFDERRRVVRIWNAVILGEGDKPTLKYGSKTGKERTVSLNDWTFEVLDEYRTWCEQRARQAKVRLRDTAFVFSNEMDGSVPMSPDYLSSLYQRARNKAGLDGMRFHDLRHFHITELLTAGVDVATVAGRVGHAGGGRMTLEVYAHFIEPADRRAADVAGAQLKPTG